MASNQIPPSVNDFRIGAEVDDPTYGKGRIVRCITAGMVVVTAVVLFYREGKEYEFTSGGLFDLSRLRVTTPLAAIAQMATQASTPTSTTGAAAQGAILNPLETTSWRQVITQIQGLQYREGGSMYREVQRRLQRAVMMYEGRDVMPRLEAITDAEHLMNILCPLFPEPWAMDIMVQVLHGKKKLPTGVQLVERPGSSQINTQIYARQQLRLEGVQGQQQQEIMRLKDIAKGTTAAVGRPPEAPSAFKLPRVGRPTLVEVTSPIPRQATGSWEQITLAMYRDAERQLARGNQAYAQEVRGMADFLRENVGELPPLTGPTEDIYRVVSEKRITDPFSTQRGKYARMNTTMDEVGTKILRRFLPAHHQVRSGSMEPGLDTLRGSGIHTPQTVGDAAYLMRNVYRNIDDGSGHPLLDAQGQPRVARDPRLIALSEHVGATLTPEQLAQPVGNGTILQELFGHYPQLANKPGADLINLGRSTSTWETLKQHLATHGSVYTELQQRFMAGAPGSWDTVRKDQEIFSKQYTTALTAGMSRGEIRLVARFGALQDLTAQEHLSSAIPLHELAKRYLPTVGMDEDLPHGIVSVHDLAHFVPAEMRPTWQQTHPRSTEPFEDRTRNLAYYLTREQELGDAVSDAQQALARGLKASGNSDEHIARVMRRLGVNSLAEDLAQEQAPEETTQTNGRFDWRSEVRADEHTPVLLQRLERARRRFDRYNGQREQYFDEKDLDNKAFMEFAGSANNSRRVTNTIWQDEKLVEEKVGLEGSAVSRLAKVSQYTHGDEMTAAGMTLLGVHGEVGEPIHGLYDPYMHFAGAMAENKLPSEDMVQRQLANLKEAHDKLLGSNQGARDDFYRRKWAHVNQAVEQRQAGGEPNWWDVVRQVAGEDLPEYRIMTATQAKDHVLLERRRARSAFLEAPGYDMISAAKTETAQVATIAKFHLNTAFLNKLPKGDIDWLMQQLEATAQATQAPVMAHQTSVLVEGHAITPDAVLKAIGFIDGRLVDTDAEASLFSSAKNLLASMAKGIPLRDQRDLKEALGDSYYIQASELAAKEIARAQGTDMGKNPLAAIANKVRDQLTSERVRRAIIKDVSVDFGLHERPEESLEALNEDLNATDGHEAGERSVLDERDVQAWREQEHAGTRYVPVAEPYALLERQLHDPQALRALQRIDMLRPIVQGVELTNGQTYGLGGKSQAFGETVVLDLKPAVAESPQMIERGYGHASLTGAVPEVSRRQVAALENGPTKRIMTGLHEGTSADDVLSTGTLVLQDGHLTYQDAQGQTVGARSLALLQQWARERSVAVMPDLEYFQNVPYEVGHGQYTLGMADDAPLATDTFLRVDAETARHMRKAILERSGSYAAGETGPLRTALQDIITKRGMGKFTQANYAAAIDYLEQDAQTLPQFLQHTFLPMAEQAGIVMNQNISGADVPVLERSLLNTGQTQLLAQLRTLREKTVDTMEIGFQQHGHTIGLNKYMTSAQTHRPSEDIAAVAREQLPVQLEELGRGTVPGPVTGIAGQLFVDRTTGLIYNPTGDMTVAHYVDDKGTRVDTRARQLFSRDVRDITPYEVTRNYDELRIERPTAGMLAEHLESKFYRTTSLDEARRLQEQLFAEHAARRVRLNTDRQYNGNRDDAEYMLIDEAAAEHLAKLRANLANFTGSASHRRELIARYVSAEEQQKIAAATDNYAERLGRLRENFPQHQALFQQSAHDAEDLTEALAAAQAPIHAEIAAAQLALKAAKDGKARQGIRNQITELTEQLGQGKAGRLAHAVAVLQQRLAAIARPYALGRDEFASRLTAYDAAGTSAEQAQVLDGILAGIKPLEYSALKAKGLERLQSALDPGRFDSPQSSTQQQLLYMHDAYFTNPTSNWSTLKPLVEELQQRRQLPVTDAGHIGRTVSNDVLRHFLHTAADAGVFVPVQHAGEQRTALEQHARLAITLDLGAKGQSAHELKQLDVTDVAAFTRSLDSQVFTLHGVHKTGVASLRRSVLAGMRQSLALPETATLTEMRDELYKRPLTVNDLSRFTVTAEGQPKLAALAEEFRAHLSEHAAAFTPSVLIPAEQVPPDTPRPPHASRTVTTHLQDITNPVAARAPAARLALPESMGEASALRTSVLENGLRTLGGGAQSMLGKYGTAGTALAALALGTLALTRPNLHEARHAEQEQQQEGASLGMALQRIAEFPLQVYNAADDAMEKLGIMIRGKVRKGSDHTVIANAVHNTLNSIAQRTLGIQLEHDDQRKDPNQQWARGLGKTGNK